MLLTTQYLDEADQLSDRITVLGSGRVVAEGTADQLKATLGGDRVLVTLPTGGSVQAVRAQLADATGAPVSLDEERRQLCVEAPPSGGTATLMAVVRRLDSSSTTVEDVVLRRPTLDEVFLTLTGGPTR